MSAFDVISFETVVIVTASSLFVITRFLEYIFSHSKVALLLNSRYIRSKEVKKEKDRYHIQAMASNRGTATIFQSLSKDNFKLIFSYLTIRDACRMECVCQASRALLQEKDFFWEPFLITHFLHGHEDLSLIYDIMNAKDILARMFSYLADHKLFNVLRDVPRASSIDQESEMPQNVLIVSRCQQTLNNSIPTTLATIYSRDAMGYLAQMVRVHTAL